MTIKYSVEFRMWQPARAFVRRLSYVIPVVIVFVLLLYHVYYARIALATLLWLSLRLTFVDDRARFG